MTIRCVESEAEKLCYCEYEDVQNDTTVQDQDDERPGNLEISPAEAKVLVGETMRLFGYTEFENKPILKYDPNLHSRGEPRLGLYPGDNSRRIIFQGKQAVLKVAHWNAQTIAHETCHFLEIGVRDLSGKPQINRSRKFDLWGTPKDDARTIIGEEIASWCGAVAVAFLFDYQLKSDEISYPWLPRVVEGYETVVRKCDGDIATCEAARLAIINGDYDFFF